MLNIGDQAPDFTLPSDTGEKVTLSSLRGRPVILYWYPRDDTPGCTKEACSFRNAYGEFARVGAAVFGISTDSVQCHEKFKNKYDLPFTLLSDPDHTVSEQYGVWGEKNSMGKQYMGVNRVTYLLDENGVVKQVWPQVKPEAHADEVLAALRNS